MKKEDLERYFEKSGDTEIITTDHVVSNDHGFATFAIRPDCVLIYNEFGDGRYWEKFFTQVAKNNGIKTVRCATSRNPAPYVRKFKFKIVGYILEREV